MELMQEVLQLKEMLRKNEIVEKVHQKEKAMLDDEFTQGLIFKYQQAMSLYNDAIRYNLEIDSYQKALSKAKEELGWEAKMTLKDMCKDSWRYIENQK